MDQDQSTGDGHLSGLPGLGHNSTLLETVTEALIFAADEPITAKHIGKVFSEVSGHPEPSRADVDAVVDTVFAIAVVFLSMSAFSGRDAPSKHATL